jgi:hypothetical protein
MSDDPVTPLAEALTKELENDDTRKHTTGTIDGYGFAMRVDGDAPAGLVADIKSAPAEVKQERESE